MIRFILLALLFSTNLQASYCEAIFENGKNPQTVEKMKDLRNLMWEIQDLVRKIGEGEKVWQEMDKPLNELILISQDLYENALYKYMTPRVLMVREEKRHIFLRQYENSYKLLRNKFQQLQAAARENASYEDLNAKVMSIRSFSTRMHYRF